MSEPKPAPWALKAADKFYDSTIPLDGDSPHECLARLIEQAVPESVGKALVAMLDLSAQQNNLLAAYRVGGQAVADRALTKIEKLGGRDAVHEQARAALRDLRGE